MRSPEELHALLDKAFELPKTDPLPTSLEALAGELDTDEQHAEMLFQAWLLDMIREDGRTFEDRTRISMLAAMRIGRQLALEAK